MCSYQLRTQGSWTYAPRYPNLHHRLVKDVDPFAFVCVSLSIHGWIEIHLRGFGKHWGEGKGRGIDWCCGIWGCIMGCRCWGIWGVHGAVGDTVLVQMWIVNLVTRHMTPLKVHINIWISSQVKCPHPFPEQTHSIPAIIQSHHHPTQSLQSKTKPPRLSLQACKPPSLQDWNLHSLRGRTLAPQATTGHHTSNSCNPWNPCKCMYIHFTPS